MCRVLLVQRSGYYAWKALPKSLYAQADEALTTAIQQSFEDSEGVYGSLLLHRNLRQPWDTVRREARREARAGNQAAFGARLQAAALTPRQACSGGRSVDATITPCCPA